MNEKIKEYGMHIVGSNLKFIRKWDFDGLKICISIALRDRFDDFNKSDIRMEDILIGAAEKLENSTFFRWRKGDALEIYRYVNSKKYLDKIKKLEKEIYLDNKILVEVSNEGNSSF